MKGFIRASLLVAVGAAGLAQVWFEGWFILWMVADDDLGISV